MQGKGGAIKRRKIPIYPDGAIYKCKPKVWFTEEIMLEWVVEVLGPYVAMALPRILPLLYLDSFGVYMMGSAVTEIQAVGIKVQFILPGCTRLVQPVDVRYNKSFTDKVKDQFFKWLMQQDIPKTIRLQAVGWIHHAPECNITDETIRNTWCKIGFEYFFN
jgi:hypothetical protein